MDDGARSQEPRSPSASFDSYLGLVSSPIGSHYGKCSEEPPRSRTGRWTRISVFFPVSELWAMESVLKKANVTSRARVGLHVSLSLSCLVRFGRWSVFRRATRPREYVRALEIVARLGARLDHSKKKKNRIFNGISRVRECPLLLFPAQKEEKKKEEKKITSAKKDAVRRSSAKRNTR